MWFTILCIGVGVCVTICHAFDCMYSRGSCGCESEEEEDDAEEKPS